MIDNISVFSVENSIKFFIENGKYDAAEKLIFSLEDDQDVLQAQLHTYVQACIEAGFSNRLKNLVKGKHIERLHADRIESLIYRVCQTTVSDEDMCEYEAFQSLVYLVENAVPEDYNDLVKWFIGFLCAMDRPKTAAFVTERLL